VSRHVENIALVKEFVRSVRRATAGWPKERRGGASLVLSPSSPEAGEIFLNYRYMGHMCRCPGARLSLSGEEPPPPSATVAQTNLGRLAIIPTP
jgi:hypothetical protein